MPTKYSIDIETLIELRIAAMKYRAELQYRKETEKGVELDGELETIKAALENSDVLKLDFAK